MLEEDIDLPESDDEEEEGGSFEHYRFVSDKGQTPLRVDKFITSRMEKTSRHRVQLAIGANYVLVNGKVVKANYIVKPLDIVTIELPYQRRGMEVMPENIPLDIVYEDEDLLLVNKPPDL
jgi:23S rRNA pseudouridine1911/1915/1917 synthase